MYEMASVKHKDRFVYPGYPAKTEQLNPASHFIDKQIHDKFSLTKSAWVVECQF